VCAHRIMFPEKVLRDIRGYSLLSMNVTGARL
jgi:hypothetical protein